MCMLKLPTVPVADPHCHYWTPNTHCWLHELADPDHAFHKLAPLCRDYLPRHHLADMLKIDLRETVYIQADMHDATSAVEEVAWVSGIASATGRPNAIIGYAPLHMPEEAVSVLDACSRYAPYRGVRFMLDFHPTRKELCQADRDYMSDPKFRKGLQLLAPRGLLFELQVCQCQLPQAAELVGSVPDVTFVLNHAGFPLRGEFDDWRAGMAQLARHRNVACKLSAFGTYDEPAFSQEETRDHVAVCLELFGVDRCMFASNLPVDRVDLSPPARWASLWDSVQSCSAAEMEKLFRRNTLRYYRIEEMPGDRSTDHDGGTTGKRRQAEGDLASARRRFE